MTQSLPQEFKLEERPDKETSMQPVEDRQAMKSASPQLSHKFGQEQCCVGHGYKTGVGIRQMEAPNSEVCHQTAV